MPIGPLSHFINWTEDGDTVSDEAEYEFTVTRSRYLVANFSTVTHAITVIALPPYGGRVTGGGNIPHGIEHTITAIPNDCYAFVMWTDKETDTVVSYNPDYQFRVEEERTFLAHFKMTTISITTSANPPEGGEVEGEYTDVVCGTPLTVSAFPNHEYTFVNWTKDGDEVSTQAVYRFEAGTSGNLVANFALNEYTIMLVADPPDLGTVSGGGAHPYGSEITVRARPKSGFSLIAWRENGVVVSTNENYTFTVERSRTLVAQFEKTMYTVIAESNDLVYGNVKGGGVYELNEIAEVKAFPNTGYLFANWTIDSVVVSTSQNYEFVVTKNVTIVANFYGLDFDTYAGTLWDNTFLLNLNKLAAKGYEITGCKWFKNGKEEILTNTIDQFSYSAGPRETDLLELAPTYYMFQLTNKDGTLMYSTKKLLTDYKFEHDPPEYKLMVYPNPVLSGNSFIIEGVTKDMPIEVYNQYGVCVSKTHARNDMETLVLNLPAGIYIIRNNNNTTRVTIIK
jgi:hypothetical protein